MCSETVTWERLWELFQASFVSMHNLPSAYPPALGDHNSFYISGATPGTFLRLRIISSGRGEGLAGTWRLLKDIIRTACKHEAAQPLWETNTQGRNKKLLDVSSVNLRWVFADPWSTHLYLSYSFILLWIDLLSKTMQYYESWMGI